MSLATLERVDSSTEAILLEVQDRLQNHADTLAQLPVPAAANVWQRFYLEDNPTASILRRPGRLFIHYSNMSAHRYRDFKGEEPIELVVGFSELVGHAEPLPITDPDSLMVGTSANHPFDPDDPRPNLHEFYRPKFWPHDGGYSLETSPDAPSLDQASIRRMAEFADRIAGMTNFVPVKIRH